MAATAGNGERRQARRMRLFFAVELPTEVRAALARLAPAAAADRAYRWADPAGLHVTLAFLGEQPADQLAGLTQVGAQAAASSQPGHLQLGQAGAFGGRAAPRVLWIGLAGDVDRLTSIQSQLDRRLREAGFSLEDRPFQPHITLARRRPHAAPGPPPAWPPRPLQPAPIPLRELTLFESRLSPRGASYLPVGRWPLGG